MPPSLADAEAALRRWFGYPALRAPQRRAIAAVLARRDALVVMPTGGGKSLCFQVPALLLDGLTVVLSPLVSLMKDQVDALARRGVPAAGVHGGLSPAEQGDALARALRGQARLLYVAPERLAAGRTLAALARARIALLAVDEAHCISEWGHDFRPAYRQVAGIRAAMGTPPAIALTATATPEVRRDIEVVCGLRAPVRIVAGFDRANLRYSVVRVTDVRRRDARLAELIRARTGPAIVYAQTRGRVERVAAALRRSGVSAAAYHAGQHGELRRRTQDRFMRGDGGVIVATSAFGMGVDKPDVRLVVHDALSPSLESYYQEAGRAGRDGAPADCALLYAPGDRRSPEHFIAASAPERRIVEAVVRAVHARDGNVEVTTLARATRVPPAQVAGALALLERAGIVTAGAGDRHAVWVRLLATPARVAALCEPHGASRALLRALWVASRGGLAGGARIPLSALPPGLGHVGLVGALDGLQAASALLWRWPDAGLRLAPMQASRRAMYDPSRTTGIDWAGLDARRAVARSRLAAMVRYAEARTCRRRVMLEYFGDRLPRVPCGGCDRCP